MMRPRIQQRQPQGFDPTQDFDDDDPHRRPSPVEISSYQSARESARASAISEASVAAAAAAAAQSTVPDVAASTTTAEDEQATAQTLSVNLNLGASSTIELSSAEATATPVAVGEEEETDIVTPASKTYANIAPIATNTGTKLAANSKITASEASVPSTLSTSTTSPYAKASDIHSTAGYTDPSQTTTLVDPTVFPDATRAQREHSGLSTGSLAAATAIPILAVLSLLLLILLCLRRKRRNSSESIDPSQHGTPAYHNVTAAGGFFPSMKEKLSFSSSHASTRKAPPVRNHIGPAAIAYNRRSSAHLAPNTNTNNPNPNPPPMMSTNTNAYYTGLATSNSTSSRGSRPSADFYAPLQHSYSGGTRNTGRRSEGGTTFVEPPPPYKAKSLTGAPPPHEYLPAPVTSGSDVFDPFGDANAITSAPQTPLAAPPAAAVAAGGLRPEGPGRRPTQRSERSFTSTLYSEEAEVHEARVGRLSVAGAQFIGDPFADQPEGGRRD